MTSIIVRGSLRYNHRRRTAQRTAVCDVTAHNLVENIDVLKGRAVYFFRNWTKMQEVNNTGLTRFYIPVI